MSHSRRRRTCFKQLSHRSMWQSSVWVGNNPKYSSRWILLALVKQRLYRGGQVTKWGINFTTCHPVLARGHHYIIVAVDYFTKWVEVMPTFNNDGETTAFFVFNQIVARFDISKEIATDHGSHFQNKMMSELTSKLGFK
jgi:hypothetical protein